MLVIYSTVYDWLPHVHEEEQGHDGKGKSDPVARETDVEVAIALVGGEGRTKTRPRIKILRLTCVLLSSSQLRTQTLYI